MIEYLIKNKEWIFSGGGVAVISAVISLVWVLFFRKNEKNNMTQKSGSNSTNIQVGGNVTSSFRDKNDGI